MRSLTFHPDALAEVRAAARYYAERVPQLGEDFVAEVRRISALIALRAEAGSPLPRGRRRWQCERFPYAVVYCIAVDGHVRVLAVAHHRRRPGFWQLRA